MHARVSSDDAARREKRVVICVSRTATHGPRKKRVLLIVYHPLGQTNMQSAPPSLSSFY